MDVREIAKCDFAHPSTHMHPPTHTHPPTHIYILLWSRNLFNLFTLTNWNVLYYRPCRELLWRFEVMSEHGIGLLWSAKYLILLIIKRISSTNINYVVILVMLYKFHDLDVLPAISSRYACWGELYREIRCRWPNLFYYKALVLNCARFNVSLKSLAGIISQPNQ